MEPRLTVQQTDIAADTTTLRSLDWDRSRFDIEFGLRNGTTYNSFLLRGERVALVDSSHAKFRNQWLPALKELIDPCLIDHLVISHTEPDHSGLVADLLDLNPNMEVVASKVATSSRSPAMSPLTRSWSRDFARRRMCPLSTFLTTSLWASGLVFARSTRTACPAESSVPAAWPLPTLVRRARPTTT